MDGERPNLMRSRGVILETQQLKLSPETWVDEHGDYLYRYAWSRLRDSNAAEEVVQETLLAGVRFSETVLGRRF